MSILYKWKLKIERSPLIFFEIFNRINAGSIVSACEPPIPEEITPAASPMITRAIFLSIFVYNQEKSKEIKIRNE